MEMEQIIKIASILSDAQHHIEDGNNSAALAALDNAKERLFLEQYTSEFKSIDGVSQHPDGYTFNDWLKANNTFLSKGTRR